MTLVQASLSFGLPFILVLAGGYGTYKLLSLIVPHNPNPIKNSRFEAGNIPTGEGRLWFPLQYYGYLLVYTTLEPIVIILFLASAVPFYGSSLLFRNLLIVVGSFLVIMYPILYYTIKQVDQILNWELRR
ncbi:NADH:ubiquinone oxidoreductase subunit 3 (chain A) [Metallosphaera yellowstonensis MK1]|jgi:NADH dehydrogenase subunit A (EC 1.6.5.3)|uniref:NADH:ubiquinone oxidoreductase subunit 3 (Chain A) n=1 Tax=Metallosphaera yellowstonensis MK1 TaxID=671065 RepID=H2C9I1_9CREN|nr:NADH-quinone oxidoreductase subunit A [Metallosphaera yellowstonensis]EHP68807.1 NADH:ubiquinone oxidoreductase subunit 3 (chain A) [Metallosphaera yellowstonensis MK1]